MVQKKKVVKYRRPFQLNIGIFIFAFIFIYLIFNVFSYLTTTHISVYEVGQGTIAQDNVYRGLVLRSEKVFTSSYTGSLNYYVREASKVGSNSLVYSVDESGNVSKMIDEAGKESMDSKTILNFEEDITNFQTTYQPLQFYHVYAFKDNLDSSLEEALNMGALESISEYAENAQNYNTFHTVTAGADGVVVYYTDGFEDIGLDNFSADMFDESSYTKTSTRKSETVSSGSPAYKLITSELWNIVIPIGEELANRLAEDSVVQIRFVKDDKTMYADYSLLTKDTHNYLVLELRSAMVRYAKERYLEVELLLTNESGLKIPNSAITEKEFFTIPADFFFENGEEEARGVLVEKYMENGEKSVEFTAPIIYFEKDGMCYIDNEKIESGARLVKTDTNQQYTVGMDTAELKGVYNINKGYTIFKQIDILSQNEEYTIVKTGTTYGISLYDHIALDGSKVSEDELINGK